ncbi:glycoside hydrolase family 38 C-terminal domain-containing protein [Lactobacillus sp. YT155]|uniref:glycoside hydrolase family 38 N-terminal domain-containing protein n=1 Tax=Lactobacillus sp. YT155 TaxID=3060955 RepID=UPI00265F42D9|nr:glycoside hydrolase family 38 C-terminal domain-containing protein [Lactobacillus sp. YT155]MDO1604494.1 glycoside hydrolase family 38 C-terminal domain-containing protein [Lactobacillus sp. YT155]
MSEKVKVNVVPHTHWDFEWYFSRYDAMIQFVHNMDEVFKALEDNVLEYYLIDGQMSIIDDYLEMCPEKEPLFKKNIESGKLFVGPWYTQTDELIVSGESIIRNLQLGMKLADKIGGYMNIGYLPDSFGQGQDMPKIYNGLNITRALFWRGLPSRLTNDRFFKWEASDGSIVNVLNINGGYFAGVPLIEDQKQLPEILNTLKGENTSEIVLPLGGDQRYVDFDIKEKLQQANEKFTSYEFVENNYPATFDELEEKNTGLDTLSGEFIDPSVSKIHRSIYSSRYDQKQFNDHLERLIIETLEPLMMMADKNEIPYKHGLIDKIWKIMSRNQAHDSAGGCNSDFTNEDIISRFKEAERLVNSEIDYLTRKMSISMDGSIENDLFVYNPQSYPIKKITEMEISTKFSDFKITDIDNKLVQFQSISKEKIYSGQVKRDTSEYEDDKYYYLNKVLVEVKVPAFSYVKYQISKSNDSLETSFGMDNVIENDKFKFEVNSNGSVTITNKLNNQKFDNALYFEDTGDEGDTYDYSPAYKNNIYSLNLENSVFKTVTGILENKMIINGEWNLPKDLKSRAANNCDTSIKYKLTVILKKNSNLIEFDLQINNTVKDHRLRVILNSAIENNYSYADTPFGFIKRKVIDENIADWKKLNYKEEPSSIYPMIHFVNAHNNKSSYTVYSKGVKEYEFVGSKFQSIALTLYRSVGFLGRPDLIRRPGVASGNQFKYIETPDSQLLRKLKFNFAIDLTKTSFDANKTVKEFHDYSIYLPHYQVQGLNKFTNILEYFVMNKLPRPINNFDYFNTKNINVEISTTQKLDNGVLVRLVNYSNEMVEGGKINSVSDLKVSYTDFNGDNKKKTSTGKEITVGNFNPGEIKTLVIEEN